MRVSIRDKGPLSEVSPAALSAYARASGWTRTDNYGDSSDVYTSDGLPEIIVPRTQRLGDYANVVSQLYRYLRRRGRYRRTFSLPRPGFLRPRRHSRSGRRRRRWGRIRK